MNAAELIKQLQLQQHVEGGYFRRTYESSSGAVFQTEHGARHSMTSIYYLLSDESPLGHWHLNQSEIVHYYQLGNPLLYSMIDGDGNLQQVVLGPDLGAGQRLQLTVGGGVWKTSKLLPGETDFGLISEAVSPGWHPDDMRMIGKQELIDLFPGLEQQINSIES